MEFYEKYGESGCSGIPFSSAEFPDDYPTHCFTEEPRLTADEKRLKKIDDIYKVIRNKTPKKAAEYIVDYLLH